MTDTAIDNAETAREAKREELKARVAEAQAREDERNEKTFGEKASETASSAADTVTTFIKERPLTAAAGGIVLGVLIAGLFKTPRQAAARGGAKAVGLAAMGAEIASGFASSLLDDAEDIGRAGARKAGDLSDSLGDRARAFGRTASHKAGDTADAARIARRETGKAIARAVGRR